ncbi:GntR family transcriptional regulator [Streptomyces sp. NPDC058464]|uniref:GntR family transcriptional regulator n=1 Tax=Streptomyces sp. NPDC058464 TaxID=3346511 RepID=UPI00365AC480
MTAEDILEGGARGKATAVAYLRDAVLSGELIPGQRLVESDFVELIGVTRGSLRAAIDELVSEELLERTPHRGARVRSVSLAQAVEILECRKVLEGLIAAKAAERIGPDGVERLTGLAERFDGDPRDRDARQNSLLNQELHALLAELAGQTTAADLIGRLNAQIVRHQFQLSLRPGRPQVSAPQHLAIIKAVTARDPAAAQQAVHVHLDSVIEALRAAT